MKEMADHLFRYSAIIPPTSLRAIRSLKGAQIFAVF